MSISGITFKTTKGKPKSVVINALPRLVSTRGEITGHYQIQYTNRGTVRLVSGINAFTYDIKLTNLDYLEDIIGYCCPALEVVDGIPYTIKILSEFTDDQLVVGITIPSMPNDYLEVHTNTILCIRTNGASIKLVTK